MHTSYKDKCWLEEEAPFSNEIEMVVLKLKWIVVLVHQFSKLKRVLRDKNAIKNISFEIGFHTKIGSFLLIFMCKWVDLTLGETSSFLSIIVDTSFLFKKPSAEVVISSFVMSYEHFCSAHSADLSPFFSYFGVFKARSLSNLPFQ